MNRRPPPSPDDWRRQGQESYLKAKRLYRRSYTPYSQTWDHDHCEFCNAKFSLTGPDLTQGYATADAYYWVCPDCFQDFREEFQWTVTDSPE